MDLYEIGQSIKQARKRTGLTQLELARIIGKTESSIRKYEKGLVQIPIDVIERISKALETTPYTLIGTDYWGIKYPDMKSQVDAFYGVVSVLSDIYGAVEEKNVYLADKGEVPYWVVGESENSFVLYEGHIAALRDSVKGLIPPLVEKMRDTRAEVEIIEELTIMLQDNPTE